MSDILNRLSAAHKNSGHTIGDLWNLCEEATDEIERLTAALSQYADHTNWQRTRDDTAYEWDGEIERPWQIAEEALR